MQQLDLVNHFSSLKCSSSSNYPKCQTACESAWPSASLTTRSRGGNVCLCLVSMTMSAGEGLVCKCAHGLTHTAFVRRHLSVCWCCPLTTPSSLSLFPGTMRQTPPVLAQPEGPNSGAQTSGKQSGGKRSLYLVDRKVNKVRQCTWQQREGNKKPGLG